MFASYVELASSEKARIRSGFADYLKCNSDSSLTIHLRMLIVQIEI